MTDRALFDDDCLRPLLEQISDGVAIAVSKPWRLIYANSTLARWLGKSRDELLNAPVEEIVRSDLHPELRAALDSLGSGAKPHVTLFGHLQCAAAENTLGELLVFPITPAGSELAGIVIRPDADLRHAARWASERRDPLTGLPDREFLLRRLTTLLRSQRARDKRFAALFIDLNDFKQVNDAHGHLVGDRVLREVARRLSGCVREGDHVVRYGGDEFVVLLEEVAGPAEIEPIIDRIEKALVRPIALPQGECRLSLSVGVAEAAPHHHEPEDVLRDADRAMYAAKRKHNADPTRPTPD
jgi:diguanylate cyclase (GGDEF)-like protein